MKKLNITFCSFPDYGGNAKALYEYIKNKYDFNITWIVYNETSFEKLKKLGIKVILIGTEEFKRYIRTTDVFFTTQGNLDNDKTDKSLYVELWHGIGPKPVGYLCNNPSKEDIKGYNHMRKIFDYMIVPNDFWKVIYSCLFHVEAKRILSLGMPILDYFKNSPGKENLSKLLNVNVKKFKKIIFYMPTFKKGFNHNDITELNVNNVFNFPIYEEKKLDDFLKDNNYLLCVKRHPGEKLLFKEYNSKNIVNINDDILIENDLSINEIINACDLMITDYSSIGTEFIFLDKPVLYTVDDMDEYKDNRGIVFSDFDFWTVGPQCNTIENLIEEIIKIFNDDSYYKREREKAKNLWFGNLKDGGCKQLCEFLFTKDGQINKHVKYYKDPELVLEEKLNQKNLELENKNKELELKNDELKKIVNSKGWKCLEKMRKIKNKIFS